MELFQSVPTWQVITLAFVLLWLFVSRACLFTFRLRSSFQPFVLSHVENGVALVLLVQRMQSSFWDGIFSVLSVLVSVEFYTVFLPFLFWTGHCRLARQMTLLMAFCTYLGNCIKDTISAPRPPTPPVRRLAATVSEQEIAMEYGLPSSHTINTICLTGYLLMYLAKHAIMPTFWLYIFFITLVFLTALGRVYLGMHSPIDVLAGLFIGFTMLAFWCLIDDPLDYFITTGNNVLSFWGSIAFLLLFAYPTPELPTPSFEFHTAFNGVALGVVWGVYRTYWQYHQDKSSVWSSAGIDMEQVLRRLLVGIPIILAAKFICRELAKRLIPSLCSLISMPIKSSRYIHVLQVHESMALSDKKINSNNNAVLSSRKLCYAPWFLVITLDEPYDVDTGIRLSQYAGLGWSVVELVPRVFEMMGI